MALKDLWPKLEKSAKRITARDMPPDPIVEAQKARELAIKQEMEEAERLRIKGTKRILIFRFFEDNSK